MPVLPSYFKIYEIDELHEGEAGCEMLKFYLHVDCRDSDRLEA